MTDGAPRWVWTPMGMEPYRRHILDVGGVFVEAEEYANLATRLKASEANLFYCPQAHAIYLEGGRKSDDDIPCPYCERDKLQEDKYALIEDFNEVQFKVSSLTAELATVTRALIKSQKLPTGGPHVE